MEEIIDDQDLSRDEKRKQKKDKKDKKDKKEKKKKDKKHGLHHNGNPEGGERKDEYDQYSESLKVKKRLLDDITNHLTTEQQKGIPPIVFEGNNDVPLQAQ